MNKVLLFEMNKELRLSIKCSLEENGSVVILATDELEALSLLSYKRFKAVVSCIDLNPGAGATPMIYKANSHDYLQWQEIQKVA